MNNASLIDSTSYRLFGEENEACLVMVHGVGMNQDIWRPQVEYFAKSFKVITYDTLGHGDSALPNQNADLDDYLQQLRALLAHLDIQQTNLIGHSMGAAIVINFAHKHPDLVRKIVALNTVYCRNQEASEVALAKVAQFERGEALTLIGQTLNRWFGESDLDQQQQKRFLKTMLESVDAVGYARAYRVFAESDRRLHGKLSELQTPAFFYTAELDPNSTPAMSERLASETPMGHYDCLASARHMMPFVNAAAVNQSVQVFLNS